MRQVFLLCKIKTLKLDPSDRLSLEDIEQFFINHKANHFLPEMIHMHNIRKFTEDFTGVDIDYFTWYYQRRPEIKASIFDSVDLRSEHRPFSKTVRIYDQNYRLSDIKDCDVPAYLNFQENITKGILEDTDRCYLFPIADNFVAALIGCLKTNGLLKNDQFSTNDLPRLPAHIRCIIDFFVVPSQRYGRNPCDIEIAMQKV